MNKLTHGTMQTLVRRGFGHKIDPDSLNSDHQFMSSVVGHNREKNHESLLKANRLDAQAQYMIAKLGSNQSRDALLRRENLHPVAKDLAHSRRYNHPAKDERKIKNFEDSCFTRITDLFHGE